MDTSTNDGLRAQLEHHPVPERTSAVLAQLAHGRGERVSFGEILLSLRHRAFGFATLVFALPACLPMPPGIPTVCGIALVVIGLNLIAMRRRLWLPRKIAEKSVARGDLQRMVDRMVPAMRRIERFCKPRLGIVTEAGGKVLVGVVLLVLGAIMILPIPLLGNMPPAFAAAVIALGMTERDGIIVLSGLVVSAAAVAIAFTATWAAVLGLVSFFAAPG